MALVGAGEPDSGVAFAAEAEAHVPILDAIDVGENSCMTAQALADVLSAVLRRSRVRASTRLFVRETESGAHLRVSCGEQVLSDSKSYPPPLECAQRVRGAAMSLVTLVDDAERQCTAETPPPEDREDSAPPAAPPASPAVVFSARPFALPPPLPGATGTLEVAVLSGVVPQMAVAAAPSFDVSLHKLFDARVSVWLGATARLALDAAFGEEQHTGCARQPFSITPNARTNSSEVSEGSGACGDRAGGPIAAPSFEVQLFAARQDVCAKAFAEDARVRACLGFMEGLMLGRGFGLSAGYTRTAPWVAVAARLDLRIPVVGDLGINIGVDLVMPLSQPRFGVAGEAGRTWVSPDPVGVAFSFGPSFFLW